MWDSSAGLLHQSHDKAFVLDYEKAAAGNQGMAGGCAQCVAAGCQHIPDLLRADAGQCAEHAPPIARHIPSLQLRAALKVKVQQGRLLCGLAIQGEHSQINPAFFDRETELE